jgi:hypothetical protein
MERRVNIRGDRHMMDEWLKIIIIIIIIIIVPTNNNRGHAVA